MRVSAVCGFGPVDEDEPVCAAAHLLQGGADAGGGARARLVHVRENDSAVRGIHNGCGDLVCRCGRAGIGVDGEPGDFHSAVVGDLHGHIVVVGGPGAEPVGLGAVGAEQLAVVLYFSDRRGRIFCTRNSVSGLAGDR